MWSDNDIDNAFQRLNPPEPESTPFPLDAWLRLETELDEAVIARAVRRRVWRFFAAEVAVVALAVLGWLLWPVGKTAMPTATVATTTVANSPGTTTALASTSATGKTSGAHRPAQLKASVATPVAPATVAAVPNAQAGTGSNLNLDSKKQAFLAKANPASIPATAGGSVAADHSTTRLLAAAVPGVARKRIRNNREATASRAASSGLASGITPSTTTRNVASAENSAAYAARQTAAAAEVSVAEATSTHGAVRSSAGREAASHSTFYTTKAASKSPRRRGRAAKRHQNADALTAINSANASFTNTDGASAQAGTTAFAETAAQAATSTTNLSALTANDVALALDGAPALPAPLGTVAVAPAEVIEPVRQPRFFVGVVGAPDVTTVKFVDVQRPMLNLGVVLEYRITQRLRVGTGLLRANKEYYARREDYDWTNYPRAATRDFSWVDGACTVLDIPLNLRYDAVVRPTYRLFGSAGLSSFFMHRERYSYDYTDNSLPYVWERDFTNENQHLFSILNLSAGYERSLGTHWSLQAEPYFKLPLAGVGAGKVKLTSAGVFLGVKYGF